MFIDCSKLPDPTKPRDDDVFTSEGATHTVVVLDVPRETSDSTLVIYFAIDGVAHSCAQGHLPGILASIGARPWGRLDRGSATRPALSRDPALVVQRLAALGPHLRALREQYGLSMGDLSRALGCPPARLSMLELAEPDPVREDAGVREDEGRAALTELLARTFIQVFETFYNRGSEDFDRAVWEAINGVLETAPAIAALSTMLRARAKGELSFDGPVDSTVLAGHLATALSQDGIIGPHREAGAAASLARAVRSPTAIDLMRRLAGIGSPSGPFKPGDKVMAPLTDSGHHGLATVEQVDVGDDLEVAVRFSGAEAVTIISPLDLELANGDAATQAAAGGLAGLLAKALQDYMSGCSDNGGSVLSALRDEAEVRELFVSVLVTDEAQRLLRLHG